MPSPNVKFMATEKTDNKRSNWVNDLNSLLQNAKDVWSRDMSGLKEDTLYGSVITDDLVSLDSEDRDDIENNYLTDLENAVDHKVDTSATDSVIVFDDHNYSFDGRAQIGDSHVSDAIRVGICGSGAGFENVISLHETLHTFNARHENHRAYRFINRSVMGATSDLDCNDGRNAQFNAENKINHGWEVCDVHDPTHSVVGTWVYHEL